jgi:hypothetical protein
MDGRRHDGQIGELACENLGRKCTMGIVEVIVVVVIVLLVIRII